MGVNALSRSSSSHSTPSYRPDGILGITMQICDEMPKEYEKTRTTALVNQLHMRLREAIKSPLMPNGSMSRFGSLALGPRDALKTIHEFRTRPFMRGMLAAMEEVRQRFPGEKIQILYAGTGPAAPLVLPVFAKYTPEQVQVDAIDFHESSIRILAELSRDMGTRGYFSSFITGDAITHRVPENRAPHIIVSETMDAGLLNEPQAYITRNLAPQLRPGGIFVPEMIEVSLSQTTDESDDIGVPLGDIYRLTAGDFFETSSHSSGQMRVQESLELATRSDEVVRLILKTRVHCFGAEVVEPNTSIITRPLPLDVEIPVQGVVEASRVNINYTLGHECVSVTLIGTDGLPVTHNNF